MKKLNIYEINHPFQLESGEYLFNVTIAFNTFGDYQPSNNNVIWVCHGLTANSDVFDWWKGLFNEESSLNTKDYYTVCATMLGSHYGTTSPLSPGLDGKPMLDNFPLITPRDMAKAHELLRKHLKIERINTLIGPSIGGQQALEWSIMHPLAIEQLILIATNARHSAYGIAFNESQRLAIYTDSTYGNGNIQGGKAGLVTARSIAMLSYRTYKGYEKTQTNPENSSIHSFLAASYQHYQGKKLAQRFNAYSYVALTKAMDAHNVGRGRTSIEFALQQVKAKTVVIGIKSDQLFPTIEQAFLTKWIPNSTLKKIDSDVGHDGFLVETQSILTIIKDFMKKQ